MKIFFKVKTSKLHFDNLSIRVRQSKAMQVETIYTIKNYLYKAYPVSSNNLKSRTFVQYLEGVFNKAIIPLALVVYEIIIANLALHSNAFSKTWVFKSLRIPENDVLRPWQY